jgi:hypothetical protein
MPQDWEAVYRAAVLEMDRQKMHERIDLVVSVLTGCLREASSSPEHRLERGRIEDALHTLDVSGEPNCRLPPDPSGLDTEGKWSDGCPKAPSEFSLSHT